MYCQGLQIIVQPTQGAEKCHENAMKSGMQGAMKCGRQSSIKRTMKSAKKSVMQRVMESGIESAMKLQCKVPMIFGCAST